MNHTTFSIEIIPPKKPLVYQMYFTSSIFHSQNPFTSHNISLFSQGNEDIHAVTRRSLVGTHHRIGHKKTALGFPDGKSGVVLSYPRG